MLIREKCSDQAATTNMWYWCNQKWNTQRDWMKCVHVVHTYTLKVHKEKMKSATRKLHANQETKTQKWMFVYLIVKYHYLISLLISLCNNESLSTGIRNQPTVYKTLMGTKPSWFSWTVSLSSKSSWSNRSKLKNTS